MSFFYNTSENSSNIEGMDNAQISNIDCDNLIVRETVDLPDLIIPSSWIISLNGDKINNPLKIDMIQEKTEEAGVTIDAALTVNGGVTTGTVVVDNISSGSGINVESMMAIQDLWLKDSDQSHYYKIVPSNLTSNTNLTLPNISNDTFLFADASQTVSNKTFLDSVIFANYSNPLKRFQFDLATITAPYLRTVVLPDASGTMVLDSATQTLTNKTLVSPTLSGVTLQDTTLFANVSDSTKKATFSCGSISTGTTRYVTIPDANGVMVLDSNPQTLSNKTLTQCVIDDSCPFESGADPLKKMYFYLGGITSGVSRIITIPNADGTLVLADNTQTLTNKSISADQIGTGTVNNTEFGYINGLNQSLSNTSSPTFNVLNTYGHINMKDLSNVYTYSIKPYYLSSDIELTIPGSSADDLFVLADLSQTISNKTLSSCGKITVTDTTDSTGITTNASIKTSGGLSVAKDIWATSFYGRYRNQYVCQLTAHAPFTVSYAYTYTKITSLASGNTNGFNNSGSSSMDAGGGTISIPVSGVYRISARCYNASSGYCTLTLGKNGSVYERAFSIEPLGRQCALTWTDVMTAGDTFCIYVGLGVAGDVGGYGNHEGIYLMAEYLV